MDLDWMNNPRLAGIDPAKLSMLQALAAPEQRKKARARCSRFLWRQLLLPARQEGRQFSQEEVPSYGGGPEIRKKP